MRDEEFRMRFPTNIRYRSGIGAAVLLFLFTIPAVAFSQPSLTARSAVEWEAGKVLIEVTAPIADHGVNLPAAKYRAEMRAAEALPKLLQESLMSFPVDSYHSVEDLLLRSPRILRSIEQLVRYGTKEYAHASRDFSSVSLVYSFSLFPDLARIFITHSEPNKPPRIFNYVPTTGYSGIVIYARGSFPVHGEARQAKLQPGLFPRIYDESMNLVLSQEMIAPDVLAEKGVLSYATENDEERISEVAGAKPLYVMALELFGKRPSDIVIPAESAARILASEENRAMLTSGKILVLYDGDQSSSDSAAITMESPTR